MATHRRIFLLTFLAALVLPSLAVAWTLDLAETVTVAGSRVVVADVVEGPIPEAAGQVVVAAGGRPGGSVEITSRAILRRLVMAGLAEGVSLTGADRCRIEFAGASIAPSELIEAVRSVLLEHLPETEADAPPSWLELEVAAVDVHSAGTWDVVWPDPRTLDPGRNLVTVSIREGDYSRRLSVVAVAHVFARTAAPTSLVPRGQQPDPQTLQWIWTDLAAADHGVVTDPQALAGMMAARDLAPGEAVSQRDLAPRPLVERGETVDLVVSRNGVSAVVRAECRQNGLMGETITVRNKLDGRLVVARVAGPGVVTVGR